MKAYFAGGCFWCMEKPYHTIDGVSAVTSGFCGGSGAASYEDVKAQKTLHRETVEIVFDENTVTFPELLDVYFSNIDPFDPDGQFIDRGRSYTCAVYCMDEAQRSAAAEKISRLEAESGKTVCVALEPFTGFFAAEEYHQNYAEKNPEAYAQEYESSGRKEFFDR